ncbi:GNAT family N-acetyltransferase [Paenibacillus montanisoli]|uniref:GNAT family N-acetyltransferase n=1 Tax=Paenibacillus montanisoli TaxID=2081970 RepID=A0A328U5G0_9BACL|nr:GNAT family N-acetyltransferase [Paenibacillus montanisoli]RAP75264.1 GNAT family N-acetyltransferase [Paenibacillus montanisoli]
MKEHGSGKEEALAAKRTVGAAISIERLDLSRTDIADLVIESESEGYRHIRRLLDDYANGRNRFAEAGEALYAAVLHNRIIGVCGLNRDPYRPGVRSGRVRRLYVRQAYRRFGAGRKLMDAVIEEAKKHYTSLLLRTTNPEADCFYRSLGFTVLRDNEHATHMLEISP